MNEMQHILTTIKRTFHGAAWHGPAVKEVLKDITAEQALMRLPNTHSIIELAGHMATWRVYVVRKLQGDGTFKVSDDTNFPAEKDWAKVLRDLDDSQAQLEQALDKFPEEKLHELVPHSAYKHSYYTILHGIVHHDLYHAGQIQLIAKSFR